MSFLPYLTSRSQAAYAMRTRTYLLSGLLLAIACSLPVVAAEAEPKKSPNPAPGAPAATTAKSDNPELAELVKKLQADPGKTSQADAMRLVTLALESGQVYAAAQALRTYNKPDVRPEFQLLAAEVSIAAGEYVLAAARLKTLVQTPGLSDEQVGRAAARLYHVLIGLLGYEDDAYQFMGKTWSQTRASAAARRYDVWFLDQAGRRNDLVVMATTLNALLAEQRPLDYERWFFWDAIEALFDRARSTSPEAIAAAGPIRDLAKRVRDSEPRRLRYELIAAHLTWAESTAGSDAPDAAGFAPVASAARAYLDAQPTAAVLNDIVRAFAGGSFEDKKWAKLAPAKRVVIAYGLAKLSRSEAREFARWRLAPGSADRLVDVLGNSEDWALAGVKESTLYTASNAPQTPGFLGTADGPARLKAASVALADVPTAYAAMIVALASGEDSAAAFASLEQQAWHLDPAALGRIIEQGLWPALRTRGVKRSDFDLAFARAGESLVAGTLVALADPALVDAWLRTAWSSATDKSTVTSKIQRLAWVPWDKKERQQALNGVRGEIDRYVEQVRRDLKDRAKAAQVPAGAEAAAIGVQAAVQALLAREQGDAGSAAAVSPALASFALAAQADAVATYESPAKALYAVVRDYGSKRTPFGRAYLRWLLQPRKAFDPVDLHAGFLADQLQLATPDLASGFDADGLARQALWAIADSFQSRRDWPTAIPLKDQETALKFNAVFAKAVREQTSKGVLWTSLFDVFLQTRRGRDWRQTDANVDVAAAVIEKDLFKGLGYNPTDRPNLRTTAAVYATLLRSDFPKLAESQADRLLALFGAESEARNVLDGGFLDVSTDKRMFALAAKLLARLKIIPLGYDLPFSHIGEAGSGTPGRYHPQANAFTRSELSRWLAQTLASDPANRQVLLAATDALSNRFDELALGAATLATQPAATANDRAAWFKRFAGFLDRVTGLPNRQALPAFDSLVQFKSLTPAETDILLGVFAERAPQRYDGARQAAVFGQLLTLSLVEQGRWSDLLRISGDLWKIAADSNSQPLARTLTTLAVAQGAAGNQGSSAATDRAAVFAAVGLNLGRTVLSEDLRNQLQGVQAVSAVKVGNDQISVKEDDPKYPVFAAQNAWRGARFETAWKTYRGGNGAVIGGMLGLIDPEFAMWVVHNHTELGEYDSANQLLRLLDQAVEKGLVRNDPDFRGRLRLADAGIAAAEKNLPLARAKYLAISESSDFDGSRTKLNAELSIADVDRLAKNFDSAETLLNRIKKRPDATAQIEAFYHLALLRIDQDMYKEAKELIDGVLTRDPGHALANIALGELNYRLRNFEEGSIVTVEGSQKRRTIEPGRPLRVSLLDKNLSVVGRSGLVEMRVWVEGGDDEVISLVPVGDSQTKFSQELPTALATPVKGDGVLQIYGGQTVLVRYSDRFIASNRIKDAPAPGRLEVLTDGELYASSGAIFTRDQLERMRQEAEIKRLLKLQVEEKGQDSLADSRSGLEVKPGNVINLKAIDLDRDVSPGRDTVVVKAKVRSGDSIEQVVLTETGDHTGIFSGTVKTAASSPVATASDSSPGSEPNAVISPKSYPAWVALPDQREITKLFTVDLNDSVQLGSLELVAKEPGRRLTEFFVQTSLSGRTFRTVGRWPTPFTPWDGSLRLRVARNEGTFSRYPLPNELIAAVDLASSLQAAAPKAGGFTIDWAKDIAPGIEALSKEANKSTKRAEPPAYFVHLQGAFVMTERSNRVFRLVPSAPLPKGFAPVLLIDGLPTEAVGAEADPLTITRRLGKGVHTIELIGVFSGNEKVSFALQCDVDHQLVPAPAEQFDPARNPEITKELSRKPALISENQDKTGFTVTFGGESARLVQLVIRNYQGDAPAINRLSLTDAAGKQVLPTKEDFQQLRRNDILEIIPGDRIDLVYLDPTPLVEDRKVHDQQLMATYSNATISACFVTFAGTGADQTPVYTAMKRFEIGDTIKIFVRDPDLDTTPDKDTVAITVTTTSGKKSIIKGIETEDHSGIFIGTVTTVGSEAKRSDEVVIAKGDDITLSYFDRENTDQGIPWERTALVEQVFWQDPVLQVYDLTASLAEEPAATERKPVALAVGEEPVRTPYALTASPSGLAAGASASAAPARGILGGPILVEFVHPQAAKSPTSTVEIYAQTAGARKYAAESRSAETRSGGTEPAAAFDIAVPGTVRVLARPQGSGISKPPLGYLPIKLSLGTAVRADALDDGRFSAIIATRLGERPDRSLATPEALKAPQTDDDRALVLDGDDVVSIGVRFVDREGKERWAIREVRLSAEPVFDVMNRQYVEPVQAAYIGESVFLRVVDFAADRSGEKDTLTVDVVSLSGAKAQVPLVETQSHSGIFKGIGKLTHADETEASGVPSRYGDTLTFTYRAAVSERLAPLTAPPAQAHQVQVYKGSDAQVAAFTKRFNDPSIAVRTQFALSESYFELAKKHREQSADAKTAGKTDQAEQLLSLARREIGLGKKLLDEVVRDYPNSDIRAQTDYLRGNLELEYATDVADVAARNRHYQEAITLFGSILATQPDSDYAPKSQFKKALAFEKMGDLDQACEEYVKLSYRYPDNELVAETIARLGRYFLNKGKALLEDAQNLTKTDPVKGEEGARHARSFFRTAGEVFGRLKPKFPQHQLAAKATVLSGMCLMQAQEHTRAITTFNEVIDDKGIDDKVLVAEAMYWSGTNYLAMSELSVGKVPSKEGIDPTAEAYRIFMRLTWDFPESVWAKYARGLLAQDKRLKAGAK